MLCLLLSSSLLLNTNPGPWCDRAWGRLLHHFTRKPSTSSSPAAAGPPSSTKSFSTTAPHRQSVWQNSRFILVFSLLTTPVLLSLWYPAMEAVVRGSRLTGRGTGVQNQGFLTTAASVPPRADYTDGDHHVPRFEYLEELVEVVAPGVDEDIEFEQTSFGLRILRGLNCLWNINCDSELYSRLYDGAEFHGPGMSFALLANSRKLFRVPMAEARPDRGATGEWTAVRLSLPLLATGVGAQEWLVPREDSPASKIMRTRTLGSTESASMCANFCRNLWSGERDEQGMLSERQAEGQMSSRSATSYFRCQFLFVSFPAPHTCFAFEDFPSDLLYPDDVQHARPGPDTTSTSYQVANVELRQSSTQGPLAGQVDLRAKDGAILLRGGSRNGDAVVLAFELVRHNVFGRGAEGKTDASPPLAFAAVAMLLWLAALFATHFLRNVVEDKRWL
ncbi:unnamed protein product [Amoebophrya sp. A25]|nr:unnamed protein product [Amoebophrya sp. A25]|eukprot:GSA25T00024394001.1